MTIQVQFLPDKVIERDAEALLAEFARERSVILTAPIPIEDIVEKHQKLRIDFDDLRHVLNLPPTKGPEPDVLGALWADRREIFIDQHLDPEVHPRMEGRYRFTLAHEGGHWRLHRSYLVDVAQMVLFDGWSKPSVICRSSQKKEPIEWQADFYASCLLMPKGMVFEAWRELFGDANPQFLLRENRITLLSYANDTDAMRLFERRGDHAPEELLRPLAVKFKVSMDAMRIRLERLDLLLREVPLQGSFTRRLVTL